MTNNVEDLNQASEALFEFTDTRNTGVLFLYPQVNDQTLTVNEGATFTLPLGFEITEIINYQSAQVSFSIDITGAAGSSVDFGTLPSYMSSNEDTPEVFALLGWRSGADWTTVSPNIEVTLDSAFNGDLTIPVTLSYIDNLLQTQTVTYDINLTVNEVVSLTSVTDIHYYTHNTAQTIAVVPQIQDTGVGYTWTVTVESLRPTTLDEIAYSGSDATFTWNSSTKIATFEGTKAGVNTALGDMTVKVEENTFWDFELEFNSSNDTNSETDISTVTCKTTDQSVMKISIADTYESPTTVRETITGGPRITATDGLFLTTISSYVTSDVDQFYADDAVVTGNFLELETTISGYDYWWNSSSNNNYPASHSLTRTVTPTTAFGSWPLFPTHLTNNSEGTSFISDDGTVYASFNGNWVTVFELSGSTWSPTAVLTHWHDVYTQSTDSNIDALGQSPVAHMSADGSVIAQAFNQTSSSESYDSKIFVHEVVSSTWTKTHEIDNPHYVTGESAVNDRHELTNLYVSATGDYILGATNNNSSATPKFFVLAYNSSTSTWSVREQDITLPTGYYGTNNTQSMAITSTGDRICIASGLKTSAPTTGSENAFCWIGNWSGSAYTEDDKIVVNSSAASTVFRFVALDITNDGGNLLLTRIGATAGPLYKYNWDGSTEYDLVATLNYSNGRLSPDGESIVTVTDTAKFDYNGTDYDTLSGVVVHRYNGTSGGTESWQSVTIIDTDIEPASAVTQTLDYIRGNSVNIYDGYVVVVWQNTDSDPENFVHVYSFDDTGRTIDNTGTPTITVFGNQTDHNTYLWDFDMLVNNGLTTPVELVYTTTQYKTNGTTVQSSRNHFINPV